MITVSSFDELYKTDFQLTNIFAMSQKWRKGLHFSEGKERRINGIIYLKNCKGRYTDGKGGVVEAEKNSIVFLPKKSRYTVVNVDCNGEDDALLIEFDMTVNSEDIFVCDHPVLLAENATGEQAMLMEETVRSYESSLRSMAVIKSKIYSLIVSLTSHSHYLACNKFASIRKGIALLESNVYENISIEDVASGCNVSSAHFRRLFKEYAKKSPVAYRMDLKIEYAKSMLINSDMSIENISDALSFESAAYFCRTFKKKTGLTPSEYRKTQ